MTKPMNPQAAEMAAKIAPGDTLRLIGRTGWTGTVKEIKGKSVWFTDGKFEHLRSLHNYEII